MRLAVLLVQNERQWKKLFIPLSQRQQNCTPMKTSTSLIVPTNLVTVTSYCTSTETNLDTLRTSRSLGWISCSIPQIFRDDLNLMNTGIAIIALGTLRSFRT